MAEGWNKRRWQELKRLERLLHDCCSIDRGSNVIERIQRIIKEAGFLSGSGRGLLMSHFMRFLNQQAQDNYTGRRKTPAEKKGTRDD